MNRKKLFLTVSIVTLVMMIAVVAVVAVLAATTQTLTSSIRVSYTARDVNATVSAMYYVGAETQGSFTTDGAEAGQNNTEISFTAGEAQGTKALNPPPSMSTFNLDAGEKIAFEYKFENTSSSTYINALLDLDESEVVNMSIKYAVSETALVDKFSATSQSFPGVYIQPNATKYLYVVLAVEKLSDDASYQADVNWNLTAITKEQYDILDFDGEIVAGVLQTYTGNATCVSVPQGVTAIGDVTFKNNTAVTEIVIPEGVTSIGEESFSGSTSLQSITIPSSVTSIGDYAFKDCTNLTKVNIQSLEDWCEIDFDLMYANPLHCAKNLYINDVLATEITIPSSVTQIGSNAFQGCTSVTRVNVSSIEDWCNIEFKTQSSNPLYKEAKLYVDNVLVEDVVIPSGIIEVKDYAFYGYDHLKTVTIPASVTNIGTYAFKDCVGLTTVEIAEGLQTIERFAFDSCKALKTINIPTTVTYIDECAFQHCNINRVDITNLEKWFNITYENVSSNPCGNLYLNGELLTDLVVPSSVTVINILAFAGCKSIQTVFIHSNVTSINRNAFTGCTGLVGITFESPADWYYVSSSGNKSFDTSDLTVTVKLFSQYGYKMFKKTTS